MNNVELRGFLMIYAIDPSDMEVFISHASKTTKEILIKQVSAYGTKYDRAFGFVEGFVRATVYYLRGN